MFYVTQSCKTKAAEEKAFLTKLLRQRRVIEKSLLEKVLRTQSPVTKKLFSKKKESVKCAQEQKRLRAEKYLGPLAGLSIA